MSMYAIFARHFWSFLGFMLANVPYTARPWENHLGIYTFVWYWQGVLFVNAELFKSKRQKLSRCHCLSCGFYTLSMMGNCKYHPKLWYNFHCLHFVYDGLLHLSMGNCLWYKWKYHHRLYTPVIYWMSPVRFLWLMFTVYSPCRPLKKPLPTPWWGEQQSTQPLCNLARWRNRPKMANNINNS